MTLKSNIKSYTVKYINRGPSGNIEQSTTIFATNKKEVDIIINFLYPLVVHSDEWKIDGVFVKTKEFEKESIGKFKYLC